MKKLFSSFIVIVLLSVVSPNSQAYESDTHLRMTYLLARAVGFNDATAKYLAYTNLYIDKSLLTSAMLFSGQRSLFHFMGTHSILPIGGHGNTGIMSVLMQTAWSTKIALAERNHPMGSYELTMGMQQGDLQHIAAGVHPKMDTYGHAGFSSMFGHSMDGHNPDRAFLETAKYEDMIRSIVRTMIAIRKTVPAEYLDIDGALNFLNPYARTSHLRRNLTRADLDDAPTVSGVINSAIDIKQIYYEDMFNNFEYKKLALRIIYDEWHTKGVIENMTFEQLFPDSLLQNDEFDADETIKAVVVADMESDFLKAPDRADILNTEKLFGHSMKDFFAKIELEAREYEFRLREYANKDNQRQVLEAQLANDPTNKALEEELETLVFFLEREQEQLSQGVVLGNLKADLDRILIQAREEGWPEDVVQEAFLHQRSIQLAQYKTAGALADRLVKDFVPRKQSEYVKQQFEADEGGIRSFEVEYKDELYRRFFLQKFGVNWTVDESPSKMVEAIRFVRSLLSKNYRAKQQAASELAKLVDEMVQQAANTRFGDIGTAEGERRSDAQGLKYNWRSVWDWNFKMLKYAVPAYLPITGAFYLKKLYSRADAQVNHEVENIESSLASGRYRNPIPVRSSMARQIRDFQAPIKPATARAPLCMNLFPIVN